MSGGPVLGGEMRGKTHVLPVRVYYEDTDAAGLVYHANYLKFTERARTEMLRSIGIGQREMRAHDGLVFVVHKADMTFRRPARLDDLLTVETALVDMGAASLKLGQVIRGGDGEEIFLFRAQVACVDGEGRPARLPGPMKAKMAAYLAA
ncbi:MAG: tol-pal system-associated acyl-CoA thioesterase [Rhodospirillaceae bacterium]|nr:tol-pal system-associated acyl-CoA thioesterase [Rhodospirillaceae bacterium]